MKKPKKVKVAEKAAPTPCPCCGYCQHCGRSNHAPLTLIPYPYPMPYVPPYIAPSIPTWPYSPTIIYGGASLSANSGTYTVNDGAGVTVTSGVSLGMH